MTTIVQPASRAEVLAFEDMGARFRAAQAETAGKTATAWKLARAIEQMSWRLQDAIVERTILIAMCSGYKEHPDYPRIARTVRRRQAAFKRLVFALMDQASK